MSEETELGLGDVVDGLEVAGVLGRGGFAIVYDVMRETSDRPEKQRLAMKVMKRAHVEKKETVARFFREAEVIRDMSSPHVPTIHDVGELEDGRPYILMERLEGRSLRQVLRADGPLDPSRVARIGAQACIALTAAHELGVLHRDLKPANLLLVGEGDSEKVMVLDFGVATFVSGFTDRHGALTKTNAIVGTPHYMSPEQIRAKALDARSDLYMLGAVLYELLTGIKPFDGETLGLLLAAVYTGAYEPVSRLAPQTPQALVEIIDKSLSGEPSARFASALEMQKALEAAEHAPPQLAPRRSRRPTMRARPSSETAETQLTRGDTPERLPARIIEVADTTAMPPGVPRPPLRVPALVFVLALIGVGGFVIHWLAQPPDDGEQERYVPETQSIVHDDPSREASPIPELPRGVAPPEPTLTEHEPPRMQRGTTNATAMEPEIETMHPREADNEATMAEPTMAETTMTETTMAGRPTADMRGELLNPFGS